MGLLDTLVEWMSAHPVRDRRRAKILRQPFLPPWHKYLQSNVAVYSFLPADKQQQLRDALHIFVVERHWEGCGGLSMTDEIKVTIAAQACLLLLGMEHDYFSHAPSILVYPAGFQSVEARPIYPGVIHETGIGLVGEAWRRGPVILAWDEVLVQGRDAGAARNVVYHEFAHQLDFQGEWPHKATSGEMALLSKRWNGVMSAEYHRLVQASDQGWATLLDQYGAENPAEFFAVATECFFCKPEGLQHRHRQLYELLRDFFGQDPARLYIGSDSIFKKNGLESIQ
jgi:Mlc titration factor MtfA (ptsG expression regulator)